MPLHGASSDVEVGEVALEEFHRRDVREVLALAGDQAVDDADAFAAADELLREVRPDEAGAAGNEIVGHIACELSKKEAARSAVMKASQTGRKRRSQPISRILSRTIIPLGPRLLAGSSDLPGGLGRAVLITPPYLVLLRAGFCLPPTLPPARCALTAPFHPYLTSRLRATRGGIFSVPLFRQVALPGRYPAHCPPEFGLSSRLRLVTPKHEARRQAIAGRLRLAIDLSRSGSTARIYPSTSCLMPYCSSFL